MNKCKLIFAPNGRLATIKAMAIKVSNYKKNTKRVVLGAFDCVSGIVVLKQVPIYLWS